MWAIATFLYVNCIFVILQFRFIMDNTTHVESNITGEVAQLASSFLTYK